MIVLKVNSRIVSIAQPLEDAKVIVQSGDGQSVFKTKVEKKQHSRVVQWQPNSRC
ncbi:hypothetical protein [Lysinibacillus sp. NPDC096259]|uniref:hypothetical protein n=1 Tax=Lysinibacillus sp. NPDC096259 TaxID=3390583 RepID=UPI003D01067B